MNTLVNLFIVDDHKIIIDGLRAMLLTVKDIKVVGHARNKQQLDDQLRHKDIDVLLLDINMPGISGIDIAAELSQTHASLPIIMLTSNTKKPAILAAVKAGVQGFLSKECDKEEVVEAVRRVAAGQRYFGHEIAPTVYEAFANQVNGQTPNDEHPLTARELEVLRCLADGMTYKEAAQALFISPHTVETHKKNIFKKMKFNNQADLIKYAIKQQIIDL